MDEVQALVARAQSGDEDAFGELVVMHHQKVFAVLFKMVKNEDDAQELAQRTWVKVWKKIDTFKGDSAFFTWVYRVATYTGLDFLRAKKRRPEVEYMDEVDSGQQGGGDFNRAPSTINRPDRDMEKAEVLERFEQALEQLSDNHRTALVLRELEGLSYEEIAEVMDCKVGTVMSRIFTARKAIQMYMKDVHE
jgi:RNA polymerase sigma-70 factor (ECF subfamily)